jgi:hypothetical protein
MGAETKTRAAQGTAYIAFDPEHATDNSSYWAEGDAARLEVERSDENEIRLGTMLRDSDTDDATFYMTEGEAIRLMLALGAVLFR